MVRKWETLADAGEAHGDRDEAGTGKVIIDLGRRSRLFRGGAADAVR